MHVCVQAQAEMAQYNPTTYLLHTCCIPAAYLLHTCCIPAAYLLHTYCILLTAHGLRLTPHDEHWQAQEEMAAAGFDFAGFGGSKRNG